MNFTHTKWHVQLNYTSILFDYVGVEFPSVLIKNLMEVTLKELKAMDDKKKKKEKKNWCKLIYLSTKMLSEGQGYLQS